MNEKIKKILINIINASNKNNHGLNGSADVSFLSGDIINIDFESRTDLPMPTMGTDGKKVYYDETFVDTLSENQLFFGIMHEFYHMILKHPHFTAKYNLNPMQANIAQDIVINAMLHVDGIGNQIPGTILAEYDGTVKVSVNGINLVVPHAHQKNFLEIYDMLPAPDKDKKDGYSMKQNGKDVSTVDNNKGEALTESEEEEINQKQTEVVTKSKMKGSNGSLARKLEALINGVVPWQNYIRPVIDRATAGFPTYARPNRRAVNSNVIFPSIKRMGVNITVAVDTSGSISPKELSYFLGEMDSMFKTYPKGAVKMNVLFHTHEVYSQDIGVKSIQDITTKVTSGGTSHLDVFVKAEELKSKVLVCLTDGYTDYPDTTTIKDVIMLVTEKGGKHPKFSKRIDINLKEVFKQ